MPSTSAGKWLLKAAMVTMVATVALTGVSPAAFAENAKTTASDAGVAGAGDGIDWDAVATFFTPEGGTKPAVGTLKSSGAFALARVAKDRKMKFGDLYAQLARYGDNPTGAEGLAKSAVDAGYVVDKNNAAGAVAYFAPGTTISRPGTKFPSPQTYQGTGHVAYVSSVNGDQVTVEEYSRFQGEGYQSYTIPASAVTSFIHLDKSSKPTTFLTGDFAPSSEKVYRDVLRDFSFGDNYDREEVRKAVGATAQELKDKVLQCGMYAEWWVANRLGISFEDLHDRVSARADIKGVQVKSTTASTMDDYYSKLGVRVDRIPAVGAIATWERGTEVNGRKYGEDTGHAAVVTRVYRLNKSDQAKADKLTKDTFVDGAKLKELIDKAKNSQEEKVTYTLLEDYNGAGGANQYGQGLMRAEWVEHYIHLAGSPLVAEVKPAERIDSYLAKRPTLAGILGTPTSDATENGSTIEQTFQNGSISYNSVTRQSSYSLNAAPNPQLQAGIKQDQTNNKADKPVVAEPTVKEKAEAQIKRINELINSITAKFAGKKQSSVVQATIAKLRDSAEKARQQALATAGS